MGRNRGPNPLIPGRADVMTLRWMSAWVSEPRAGPTPTQVPGPGGRRSRRPLALQELVARPEPSRTVGRPILDLLTKTGGCTAFTVLKERPGFTSLRQLYARRAFTILIENGPTFTLPPPYGIEAAAPATL